MEKIRSSSGNSTSNSNGSSNSRENYLRHLNKISHKISKPIRKPSFDHLPPPPPPPLPSSDHQHQLQNHQQQQQNQPPVYNINKSDFRDVVQKLTGSPAHDRFSNPPPIHPPKPQSSRLQRIRPPPLAHVSNRPPLVNNSIPPPHMAIASSINDSIIGSSNNNGGRSIGPISPLSPLPPFPAVHATAESPISAYMRYLQTSFYAAESESKRFSGVSPMAPLVSPLVSPLLSPRWNNPNSWQMQQQTQQFRLPSPTPAMAPSPYLLPSSPLAFGRIPSPRSPYPLLSPSFLFSPSTGQLGFPLSPRIPLPSPRWRNF